MPEAIANRYCRRSIQQFLESVRRNSVINLIANSNGSIVHEVYRREWQLFLEDAVTFGDAPLLQKLSGLIDLGDSNVRCIVNAANVLAFLSRRRHRVLHYMTSEFRAELA